MLILWQVTSGAATAGVATAGVGISKGDDAKAVLHRTLMNMSFGAAGVSSSILAPKLMQAFGISRQVAVELAEEIINAAAAYGITTVAGESYGSQDAFLDIITGMVIARIAGAGAGRNIEAPKSNPTADIPANKPTKPTADSPKYVVPDGETVFEKATRNGNNPQEVAPPRSVGKLNDEKFAQVKQDLVAQLEQVTTLDDASIEVLQKRINALQDRTQRRELQAMLDAKKTNLEAKVNAEDSQDSIKPDDLSENSTENASKVEDSTSAEVKQITDYIEQIDNIDDLNRLSNELKGVKMERQTRLKLEAQMNRKGNEIINQNPAHKLEEIANKPVVDDVKDLDHQEIDKICSQVKDAKTSDDYINILEKLKQLPESIYGNRKIAEVTIAKQQFEQKPSIEITEASRIAAEGPFTGAHLWEASKASEFYRSLTQEQKIIVDTYGISHDDIFSIHGILRLKLSKYDTPYTIEGRYLQTKSRIENGQLDSDSYIRTSGPEIETMFNCQESLRNAAACEKRLVIITGRAGGGKSTVARTLGLEDNFYFPDADDLKAFLPGYQEFGAGYVHDLSVRLNTEFTDIAFSEGRNVVFQTTGWSDYVDTIIANARAKGYTDITLVHVDVSTEISIKRSTSRAEATGRTVDPGRIETGTYVDRIVLHCLENQADNIKAVILVDNNGAAPEFTDSYSL